MSDTPIRPMKNIDDSGSLQSRQAQLIAACAAHYFGAQRQPEHLQMPTKIRNVHALIHTC